MTVDRAVAFGKPVVKCTRLAAEFMLDLLAHDCSVWEALENYPRLKREGILAYLPCAGELVEEQIMYPIGTK